MLLTMKQLIERSGRSKQFVYDTLKDAGIEISDFYDDSVLRYLRKEIPEGLLSVKQMAAMSGLTESAVRNRLFRAHIKIAFNNGNERSYDASTLEVLTRKRETLTDEERKERIKKSKRKYAESHRGQYNSYKKKYYEAHKDELNRAASNRKRRARAGYFFVSIKVPSHWRIVACSLSYLDAALISAELNALGITAHFRSHIKA